MPESIAGVWELVSDTRDGLIVATNTHASAIIMDKGRRRFQQDEPTDAEAAEAYRSFITQAGPYTMADGSLIHHRTYTRNPNGMGSDEVFEYHRDGERLILQPIDPDGTRYQSMTWRKVNTGNG